MKLLFALLLLGSIPGAFAQDSFLRACQSPETYGDGVQTDIKWFKLLYQTEDCKRIAEALDKHVDLGHLFFNKIYIGSDSLQRPNNWTSFFPEYYGNDAYAANLYVKSGFDRNGELFTDLSIYRDFRNIMHANFGYKELFVSKHELCDVLNVFPNINIVSLPTDELTKKNDDCLTKRDVKVIIKETFVGFEDYVPQASIIGIENFEGELPELLRFEDLRYIGISEDPERNNKSFKSIGDLATLTELSHLSFNLKNLNYVSEIGKIVKLEWLSISTTGDGNHASIEDLTFLNRLTWLKELNLSQNNLTNFNHVKNLKRLKILKLAQNAFKEVPVLEGFRDLRYLDMSGNQIMNLENLRGLRKLKYVNIANNMLSDLSVLSELPELVFLNASYNKRTIELGTLESKSIKVLNLSGRCPSFQMGAVDIRKLVSLFKLDLKANSNEDLDLHDRMYYDTIARDLRFPELEIKMYNFGAPAVGNANSKKCDLPPLVNATTDFQRLPELEVLVLRNQRLQELPDFLELEHLKKLDIQGNTLRRLTTFKAHPALKEIDLSYNFFSKFPSFGHFPAMEMIQMTANDLLDISPVKELLKTNDHMGLNFSYSHIKDLGILRKKEYKNFKVDLFGRTTVEKHCPKVTKNLRVTYTCKFNFDDRKHQ